MEAISSKRMAITFSAIGNSMGRKIPIPPIMQRLAPVPCIQTISYKHEFTPCSVFFVRDHNRGNMEQTIKIAPIPNRIFPTATIYVMLYCPPFLVDISLPLYKLSLRYTYIISHFFLIVNL